MRTVGKLTPRTAMLAAMTLQAGLSHHPSNSRIRPKKETKRHYTVDSPEVKLMSKKT